MNIDKNREFNEKVIDNDFNLEFQSTKIEKYISNLQQENTQLKECIKDLQKQSNEDRLLWKKHLNENAQLKQQLKDKDEKISKAVKFIKENEYFDFDFNSYQLNNYKNIKYILESNKED